MTTGVGGAQVAAAGQDRTLRARLVLTVLVPFACGYFLSYYFRTINALISGRLVDDFGLDAQQLGLLTAAYFLACTLGQIPLGMALDRYGPRRVQGLCMVVAAAGAAMFGVAHNPTELVLARLLIGLGVATALMAGLKAIVLWFPKERIGLFNGIMIMLGAAGALAAAAPTEILLSVLTWRQLFWLLGALCLAIGALMLGIVPEGRSVMGSGGGGFRLVVTDRRFWRLAPLSALVLGAAWAEQGLWAAPWLRDVAHLQQGPIVQHLVVMSCALCAGALCFGILADRLQRAGIGSEVLLAGVSLLFVLAEIALALKWPLSTYVVWSVIGAVAAGTVFSYTIMAQYFSREITGRANGALNMLHFAAAFAVQYFIGFVASLWTRDAMGHYAPEAYGTPLLALAAVQLLALIWFLRPLPAGHGEPAAAAPREPWRRPLMLAALGLLAAGGVAKWQDFAPHGISTLYAAPVSARPDDATREAVSRLEGRLDTLEQALRRLAAAAEREASAPRREPTDVTGLGRRLDAVESALASVTLAKADGAGRDREPRSTADDGAIACGLVPAGLERITTLGFERNQARLGRDAEPVLERVAQFAARCRLARIVVDGFTDDRGSQAKNLALSRQRAEGVAERLAALGLDRSRVTATGRGPDAPAAAGTPGDGRATSRRVEVRIDGVP